MGSAGHSFVTGWGVNPPKRPHHRNAFCAFVSLGQMCDFTMWENKNHTFANVLVGGLVGGPVAPDDVWTDDHTDYHLNEVALDYNAALVSGAPPSSRHCKQR